MHSLPPIDSLFKTLGSLTSRPVHRSKRMLMSFSTKVEFLATRAKEGRAPKKRQLFHRREVVPSAKKNPAGHPKPFRVVTLRRVHGPELRQLAARDEAQRVLPPEKLTFAVDATPKRTPWCGLPAKKALTGDALAAQLARQSADARRAEPHVRPPSPPPRRRDPPWIFDYSRAPDQHELRCRAVRSDKDHEHRLASPSKKRRHLVGRRRLYYTNRRAQHYCRFPLDRHRGSTTRQERRASRASWWRGGPRVRGRLVVFDGPPGCAWPGKRGVWRR